MSQRVKETLERLLEPGEELRHWVFGQSFQAGRLALYGVVAFFTAAVLAALLAATGIPAFITFWLSFALILAALGTKVTTIYLFGITDRRLIVARYQPDMWQLTPRFEKPAGSPQAAPLPASNALSMQVTKLKSLVFLKAPKPVKVICGYRGQLAWQKEHVMALAESAKAGGK